MKHLFIINPVAGGRQGRQEEVTNKIKAFAVSLNKPYEIYHTTAPMDACRKIIEEADKTAPGQSGGEINLIVYACGGDGTLNECANGAAGHSNIAVTHYPCGTGNDFLKTFGPDNTDKFRDLSALSKGEVRQLDIIECIYGQDADGGSIGTDNSGSRVGINLCSVGIDARIGTDVHKYSRIPIIGGNTGYIVSLIVNVIKGITQHLTITCSGIISAACTKESVADGSVTIDREVTLACACNGRYYGGGFNPVPDALTDDGVLECLVVEPVSRLNVAGIVGKYAEGKFRELPELISYIRCTQMEIEADREFVINIDGERVVSKKVVFRLIPKGINYIFPGEF